MRVPLPALLLAASTALAADPRIVGPPEQTPAPQPAPSPAPGPRPAIPQPAEPPSPTQAQPGADTEKQPLVVRVLPTQKTAEEVEAEKAERDERVAAERSLTNYTRYLWLATCALAFVAFAQAGLFVCSSCCYAAVCVIQRPPRMPQPRPRKLLDQKPMPRSECWC